ncbi:MAG TPA: hypothetical protein PK957_03525 [Candidatus Dojkabacteria bacterium]|nr:hypothetical protein [Candidatus Dojkabacteria bacterium]HQF36557.1 hypothetical protein [Candidatus Dojkabacteria bacterium]
MGSKKAQYTRGLYLYYDFIEKYIQGAENDGCVEYTRVFCKGMKLALAKQLIGSEPRLQSRTDYAFTLLGRPFAYKMLESFGI